MYYMLGSDECSEGKQSISEDRDRWRDAILDKKIKKDPLIIWYCTWDLRKVQNVWRRKDKGRINKE